MRILILEDDNDRINWFAQHAGNHGIVWANRADTAISALKTHDFHLIFLDHDLNDAHYLHLFSGSDDWTEYDHETGFAVAKFLKENPDISPAAQIVIHTQNEKAQERMAYELLDREAKVLPFPMLKRQGWIYGKI